METPSPVRLNFQITKKAQERLEQYCEWSGRSASDVVRQLVTEYLADERPLRGPVVSLNGRRTNCTLPSPLVRGMDARTIGGITKGLIISRLLEDFLIWRHDGAVVLGRLVKLVRACEQRDKGDDPSLYHEALAQARETLRRGDKDG